MIKAVIIDDEPSAVSTLGLMLQRYTPVISDVRSSTHPQEALQLIRNYQPHLVFLDVQMPLMNGFELLKRLDKIDFRIIFTTAYDHYAIQAIRFSALDYLLKPIDADELIQAVSKFIKENKQQQELYQNLLQNASQNQSEFRLAFNTQEGSFFHYPREIIRVEGENNYSKIFFENNKKLLLSKTLKEFEEMLADYGFIRVHKSHLVNKKHVRRYSPEGWLAMSDGTKVEVSRRRREKILDALKDKPAT
ncbi:MAG TPA: LytTR family DNA-binding domain-containing protein [Chitinophagaceae bacterium]|nr:LytTR family DNA-binding domain-containing protein [Chitinophagaceae bacterium]